MKLRERLRKFLVPDPGSPRWMFVLPYVVLLVIVVLLLFGGIQGWEYTNSPTFCGTTCHTMPPEYSAYLQSPHANVTCEECHIGRAGFVDQFIRKSQAAKEIYDQVFDLYKLPIRADALRPARDTCEKCHQPETFSNDSLVKIDHYANDRDNTATSIYLILKTGGGKKREGQGLGIHWHIMSKVLYYSDDPLTQTIPYVRVYNDDGTYTEYTDVSSGFDPSTIKESQLKVVDCITCHNRVTHNFKYPSDSVDQAMSHGLIDPSIPLIHQKAVAALSAKYASHDDAVKAIAAIEDDYKNNLFDFYSHNGDKIKKAIAEIQVIYDQTVFPDQKIDWTTSPNNLGHMEAPGCFRCHDGKHLNPDNQAIRLECNLCHSIPIVATSEDFVTTIEISRGPEPDTHRNPNWISLHNQAIGPSCSNCHTTSDPGGTSNTSFCSNSACHGNVFTYAGFDAPVLREKIKDQLPPPEPTAQAPTLTGSPTFDNYIGPLFAYRCTGCHNDTDAAPKNLDYTTYASAMRGGSDGPVIIPGDSADSLLIKIQSASHFSNFTPEELAIVKQWIDAGAPEK